MNLTLTTADNYTNVIFNGTTIKQIWFSSNGGTKKKVYQKWKTVQETVYDKYTSTIELAWQFTYKKWLDYSDDPKYGSGFCEYGCKYYINSNTDSGSGVKATIHRQDCYLYDQYKGTVYAYSNGTSSDPIYGNLITSHDDDGAGYANLGVRVDMHLYQTQENSNNSNTLVPTVHWWHDNIEKKGDGYISIIPNKYTLPYYKARTVNKRYEDND